ncbi:MAG: phosphomethylpyrimidine synthase ThiC [Myxococcota bacterium]|nr:phosphomethylpyrimidine synthase ThiC [Myxococcota bacterium]
MAKLTAHAANVAPYRPGAGDRDDATSRARCAFDWNPQLPLAMAPETARAMHDETLPQEGDKSAEFCRMCGPKPCAMHIDAEMHRLTRQLTDAGTLALAALGPHEDAPTHVTPTSAFKIPQT